MTTQSFADQATQVSEQEQGTSLTEQPVADKAQQQGGTSNVEALFSRLEKRLNDKDEFIETLKSERKTDRDEIARRDAEIAELREKLEASLTSTEKVDSALKELTQKREVSSQDKAEVNLDEVIERATARMEEKLSAKQIAEAEEANFRKVEAAVKERFGDSYLQSITARCAEIGMPLVELDRLSKVAPAAALEVLLPKTSGSVAPTKGSFNTKGFNEQPQQHKPKSVMGLSNTKADVEAWRSYRDS